MTCSSTAEVDRRHMIRYETALPCRITVAARAAQMGRVLIFRKAAPVCKPGQRRLRAIAAYSPSKE
jgi:hypothetical protein